MNVNGENKNTENNNALTIEEELQEVYKKYKYYPKLS